MSGQGLSMLATSWRNLRVQVDHTMERQAANVLRQHSAACKHITQHLHLSLPTRLLNNHENNMRHVPDATPEEEVEKWGSRVLVNACSFSCTMTLVITL